MTAILGISAFYHDSAAALLVDGEVVAAAQEERFTRKKHDADFPVHAIGYCLDAAGLSPEDLDYVGFYEKPLLRFDRLLETYLSVSPRGFAAFRRAMPDWLRRKLHLPREMDRGFQKRYRGPYVFCEHHESHAASAFFASPFEEAAILTMDGVGEWATSSTGYGRGNQLTLTHEMRFPHSLGLLYSAFTYYLGFKVNSGEYKVMGLAPYGTPRFVDLIRQHIVDVHDDGSLTLAMSHFSYCHGLTMTSPRFHRLFGREPRNSERPLDQVDMDLAASIQVVAEEIVLRAGRHLHERTGMHDLVLAGGVALNCVANGRLEREGPFRNLWVQPAAGDAGGALGIALFVWHQLLHEPRQVGAGDKQHGSLLGPSFSDEAIRAELDDIGIPYEQVTDEQSLRRAVADELAAGRIVGWFNGRMEYGPRALGARSILGDPRDPRMQSTLNLKIKYREGFRPFAPAVLASHASDYFELGHESPYMTTVAPIAPSQRLDVAEQGAGFARLAVERSTIPATTHVDDSARVQTVTPDENPRFHGLLTEFHRITGCPVLVNTSFNIRGEPIVASPQDAYGCFLRTGMDVLVLGNCILRKQQQSGLCLGRRARLAQPWHELTHSSSSTGYGLDD